MIEQRSADWFQARLGKATASRFQDIMAGDRYATWKNYRAELVAERTTGKRYSELVGRDFTTFEMTWGTDNEPLARLHYTLNTKNQVEECSFYEHEYLAAGASPDGLINGDGVLEVKCPLTATHIETLKTGKIPNKYVAQVQGQLWITGRKWADFVSFDPRLNENARLFIIRVPRDEAYIIKLESEVIRFLKEVEEEVEFISNYNKEPVHETSNLQNPS